MIFKKPYRNLKREAAIWILNQLLNPKIKVTKDDRGVPVNTRTYSSYEASELEAKNVYRKEILRDAIEMLFKNGHISFAMENQKDIYQYTIRTNYEGESAIKDGFYEDEITTYNNDKYYSYFRWVLPIAAIIISILSLLLTTCQKRKSDTTWQTITRQDTISSPIQNKSLQKDQTGKPETMKDSLPKTVQ